MIAGSRMRLTLVTETFPPEVNGVARTLGRWVEAFTERGHTVRVVRPRQPVDAPSPDHVHGLPVPLYPQLRFGVASPLRVRGIFMRQRPDLVHIATEGPLGWAALMAASAMRLPVASSFHTNFDHYLASYGFAGLERLIATYLAWFHNQTAVTLAPSEATVRRLRANGVERVEIWSRGVDSEAFNPRHRDAELRQTLGLDDDGVLLVYVGRLAPEKNLPALLEAFGRLRARTPEAQRDRLRLALVGGGPLLTTLQAAGAPGVIVAGERHGADLARWYASGDVFAFPSQSETFGNVMLEAQASGLPVVGYDCQGVNERIEHEADGLLVPCGGDFAAALELLVRDPARRRYYGTAARAKAEQQGWSGIFDVLEQRYQELVVQKKRPASLLSGATMFRLPWTTGAGTTTAD